MTPSDAELMQHVVKRDTEAFALLFERYQNALADHLCAMTRDVAAADDLVQEVFLRVWNRAEQWSGAGAFRSWLFRIGTNLALNYLRGKRRRREQPLEMPTLYDEDEDDHPIPRWMVDREDLEPDTVFERSEQYRILRRLIADLPEDKREVFEMVHDGDMALREVAERLAIPEGTVKSRLFHAREYLANAWQQAHQA